MKKEVRAEIGVEASDEGVVMPRKANEVIAEAMAAKPQPPLFGDLWQSGETALVFGAAGIGVSLFAYALGDALARGRPIEGFDMPSRRHKVLYVDLVLSDAQFQRRYTPVGRNGKPGKPYEFADRFRRDRPGYDEDLCAWVRKMVRLFGFEVVVIDDLSAVMRTDDGTFDSLRIMREMKRMSLETGVSVLVLADSYPSPRHDISEADLRRSQVLCRLADSVFGIGSGQHGRLKLVQFRSQGAEIKWGSLNPIGCAIARDKRGVLGFAFDERFAPKLDPVRCMFICRANKLWGEGKKFREIAKAMDIPVSQASRLFHAWTPSVHKVVHGPDSPLDRYGHDASEVDDDEYDDEYDDEFDESDTDEYADEDKYESPLEAAPAVVGTDESPPNIRRLDTANIPFAAALGRRLILDLERRTDGYGEIFVESASPPTGKPVIWYKQNRQGNFTRFERKLTGILTQNIGMSGFVP